MAEICCGVVSDNEASSSSGAAIRRRMELRQVRFPDLETEHKRPKSENYPSPSSSREFRDSSTPQNCVAADVEQQISVPEKFPKFGSASVCGRRRDMEDAVAIHPSFIRQEDHRYRNFTELHYFAVFDGHGCSHIATKCRDRLHEVVKEQFERSAEWKEAMERSFEQMDKEAIEACKCKLQGGDSCRCEHQAPECNTVGSTAIVAVLTHDKIIVANCGDSRAVLCRDGKAIPLSSDHKPDRPDEFNRIQSAGGRVIYSDGPRVLGVLAMSRAIGDNFLKPFVTCEPEITITDRTPEDDCLILASDGLWDVVTNYTACGVAMMCLSGKELVMIPSSENEVSDKCTYASMLLTKLALARHSSDNVSVVVVDLKN